MGPGGWQEVLDKDQGMLPHKNVSAVGVTSPRVSTDPRPHAGECITAVRSGAAELAALLSPTKLFFQSPTKPGFKVRLSSSGVVWFF